MCLSFGSSPFKTLQFTIKTHNFSYLTFNLHQQNSGLLSKSALTLYSSFSAVLFLQYSYSVAVRLLNVWYSERMSLPFKSLVKGDGLKVSAFVAATWSWKELWARGWFDLDATIITYYHIVPRVLWPFTVLALRQRAAEAGGSVLAVILYLQTFYFFLSLSIGWSEIMSWLKERSPQRWRDRPLGSIIISRHLMQTPWKLVDIFSTISPDGLTNPVM